MQITRFSRISDRCHTQEIDTTPDSLECYYLGNLPTDKAFATLTQQEREFIRRGVTKEEWNHYILEESTEEVEDIRSSLDSLI